MKELAARELAAIDAISEAITSERRPDFVILLHGAKDGHQTAYAQLAALARIEGDQPATTAGLAGTLVTWQTRITQLIGHDLTLHAMRAVEDHLAATYRETAKAAQGVRKEVLGHLADHAQTRATILTAHIAKAKHATDETKRLPLPLTSYFARDTARACMRCHVDRPGVHPAIERVDPVTYVCSACHDETRQAFPPELIPLIDTWPEEQRHARILEKALGKPSKDTARKRVHTVLAGLPPEVRGPVRTKVVAGPRGPSSAVAHACTRELALEAATSTERTYSEHLFDPARMRTSW